MRDSDTLEFRNAIQKVSLFMRFLVGQQHFCAACFCEAMIEELTNINASLEHGETLTEITSDEMKLIMLAYTATVGSS